MSNNAVIKECRHCKDTPGSRFQDREYGKNMRVHNPLKVKPNIPTEFRCTVCGNVKK